MPLQGEKVVPGAHAPNSGDRMWGSRQQCSKSKAIPVISGNIVNKTGLGLAARIAAKPC